MSNLSPSSRLTPASYRPGWTSRSPKRVLGNSPKKSPRRRAARRSAEGGPRNNYYINDNIMLEFTPAKLANDNESSRGMNLNLQPMYPGGDIAKMMKY